MAPIRLYLAGPLFCEAEQEYNRRLKERLSGHGFEVLLPQELDQEIPTVAPGDRETVNKVSKRIFDSDLALLDSCDALVLNMDGRVPDEGACVELGYAYAKGMPCFGIKTDVRTAEQSMDNMMITGALDGRIAGDAESLARMMSDFFESEQRAVPADGDLVNGDVLSGGLDGRLDQANQRPAAGHFHSHDVHRCDVVLPQDVSDLIESGSVVELGAPYDQRVAVDEPPLEVINREGGAVRPDHEPALEEPGGRGDERQLDGPLHAGRGRGHRGAAHGHHRDPGRGPRGPLREGDRPLRARGEAVPHAVAQVVADDPGFAVDERQRPLVAGGHAQPAAVALGFVYDDRCAFHEGGHGVPVEKGHAHTARPRPTIC